MSTYIKGLILTILLCNLIQLLVPELNGDGVKRYVKYLCGLVVLITLLSPLMNGWYGLQQLSEGLRRFFTVTTVPADRTVQQAYTEGSARETAYAVIAWINREYNIPAASISVEVQTESDGENRVRVTELRVMIYNCSLSNMENIRRELSEMTDCRILVTGREKGG